MEAANSVAWVIGPPPEQLQGDGFVLRRRLAADAEDFFGALEASRAHLEAWLPARVVPRTLEATRSFLLDGELAWEQRTAFHYALYVDGAIAGAFALFNRVEPFTTELGWWIGSTYVRRGLARHAGTLLVHAGFDFLGATSVVLIVDETNVASMAAAASLGCILLPLGAPFAPEPPFRRWVVKPPSLPVQEAPTWIAGERERSSAIRDLAAKSRFRSWLHPHCSDCTLRSHMAALSAASAANPESSAAAHEPGAAARPSL